MNIFSQAAGKSGPAPMVLIDDPLDVAESRGRAMHVRCPYGCTNDDNHELAFTRPRALASHLQEYHPTSRDAVSAAAEVKAQNEKIKALEVKNAGLEQERSVLQAAASAAAALQLQVTALTAENAKMKPIYETASKEITAEEEQAEALKRIDEDPNLRAAILDHLGVEEAPADTVADSPADADSASPDKLRSAIELILSEEPWQSRADLIPKLTPYGSGEVAAEIKGMLADGEVISKQGSAKQGRRALYALSTSQAP